MADQIRIPEEKVQGCVVQEFQAMEMKIGFLSHKQNIHPVGSIRKATGSFGTVSGANTCMGSS